MTRCVEKAQDHGSAKHVIKRVFHSAQPDRTKKDEHQDVAAFRLPQDIIHNSVQHRNSKKSAQEPCSAKKLSIFIQCEENFDKPLGIHRSQPG